jgi:hypothetical protein
MGALTFTMREEGLTFFQQLIHDTDSVLPAILELYIVIGNMWQCARVHSLCALRSSVTRQ